MSWWNRPHKHYWVTEDRNPVSDENGKQRAMIVTYRCYACGSVRYDKIDGNGFVSSTITNDRGQIVSGTGRAPVADDPGIGRDG